MSLLSVFDEIVSIMHNDYAGIVEKHGCDNPDLYKTQLINLEKENNLSIENFFDLVQEYLLDFKDKHVGIINKSNSQPSMTNGFKVRRFEDNLYITEINDETSLEKGMKITSINNKKIPELAKYNRSLLKSEIIEREEWNKVLLKNESCVIEDKDKNIIDFKLNKYPFKSRVSNYTLEEIQDKTILLKINDFMDPKQLFNLIENNKELISQSENLIIDIRENGGGSDSTYEPLKFIFPPKFTLFIDGVLVYMTERNYKNRLNYFNEWKKNLNSEEQINTIDTYLSQLKDIINKGFSEVEMSKSQTVEIDGSINPKNVIVLIDKDCGSSGDQFALISSYSSKVKLLGRNTSGVLDYSNVAFEKFEEYGLELMYPTTKSVRVINGKGIDNIGVKPDVYIQWTPEHIDRDIDLEIALDYLNRG